MRSKTKISKTVRFGLELMSENFRNTLLTSEPVQVFPGSSKDVTKTSETFPRSVDNRATFV